LASAAIVAAALCSAPAWSAPTTTLERTIIDREADDRESEGHNILDYGPGEDYTVVGADPGFRPPRHGSILNFLQLSDFQMVDEESPGRVEFFDSSQRLPGLNPFAAAYRPQESLTTQITEAMVRQVRNTHSPITAEPPDLSILTGDNADSQQYNETRWFIDILDGTDGTQAKIDPNSGVEGSCEPPDGELYDGVRGGGNLGYYEPDSSAPNEDGDGYSPRLEENSAETGGRDVTVRDFPGLFEDAQKRFEAVGLDMPWYTAFGNHDALVQGNSPDAYRGPGGPLAAPNEESPADPRSQAYDRIVRGCEKPASAQSGVSLEEFLQDPEGSVADTMVVPRDDRRCYLAKDFEEDDPVRPAPPCETGWIDEHSNTRGLPIGHGFEPFTVRGQAGPGRPEQAQANHDGYYAFTPAPGIRFVVMDTITDECGTIFCSEGSVDDLQYDWVDQQIADAAANGQYVLLFSHHTLRTTRMPSVDETEYDPITGDVHFGERYDPRDRRPVRPDARQTLKDLVCRHSNVLAHVNGHEHENYVIAHRCPDLALTEGEEPPPGPTHFYEISTAAHIDWPQQSRMIELVRNEDATLSLVLTMIDHDGVANPGGSRSDAGGSGEAGNQVQRLGSIGRELAYNDYQASRGARGGPADRNVIIKTARLFPFATD
jgi:metallophosphoesterase (TIGR03767 family)